MRVRIFEKRSGFVFLVVLALSGCLYQKVRLPYDEFSPEMKLSPKSSLPAGAEKRLIKITADQKGVLWTSCATIAKQSLYQLMDEARRVGASEVQNIRWLTKNEGGFEQPHCVRRWGVALFPPLLLTEHFMSATVEGEAIVTTPPKDK